MTEPVVTFAGKAFGDLREDQKLYVSHVMLSWHTVGGFWYSREALCRAIKKAQNNLP